MARPRDFNIVEIKQFKGLDIRGPAELVPQSTFQVLQNFEVGLAGELKKRPGFVRQHNGTTLGLFGQRLLGELSTGTAHQIVVQNESAAGGAGKVYASSDSGVTWAQISTPAATNYVCGKGAQWGGQLFIPTSTVGNLARWDGTTYTPAAGGASAPASILRPVILQDRLFLLEATTLNIRWSEVLNFASWPAANSITYKTEDRDYPVGIINYRDRLIILRQNSIQVLYLNGPPSSWILKTLPYNVGVMNENCAIVYNDLLYLLSLDGIYRTDLTSIDEISKPLTPVFYQRRKFNFSTATIYYDALGYWNSRIICSVRTATQEFRCFVYNLDSQTWSEWLPNLPGPGAYPYAPFRDFLTVSIGKRGATAPYIKEGLYSCFADALGKIVLLDDQNPVYVDEVSSTYNAVARTRNIDADLSEDLKRVYSMSVRGKKASGATISGLFNVNGVDGSTFTIPMDAFSRQSRFKGPGYFREAALQISDNSSAYLEIEAFTAHAKAKSAISESRV